ncbi:efflux RND transporter permease subunit [Desulfobotulus sp.]|uniref:efflux RND transporter permease subunit n=1 Tax=Desulfobotulus sp. TaxID=1940337 RepID=UPI002A366443|nr:efflux RND transporter permease subunit [Desulfobotulus sp.]MDY0163397.1 efflux RND transporter permease subunit [Desulfobotulus sp.]
MMQLTQWTLKNRTVAWVMTILLIAGGVKAYLGLGRLEYPAFTIKTALVITAYPGATAEEVEKEVTHPIETAVQQLSQIKQVKSISRTGLSIIFVDIQESFMGPDLPQIWDELRRKVGDIQPSLPEGVLPSQVNDDFGDEYGIFFALTGEGYSFKELKDYADILKRELLLVRDVARVEIWGDQPEAIYFEVERSRMVEMGISIEDIADLLNRQHRIVDAGTFQSGREDLRIRPTGGIQTIEGMGSLLVKTDTDGNLVRLSDIAAFKRAYQDPPQWMMRYNGFPALGIGVAIMGTGNVVEMGKAVKARIAELEREMPLGMELAAIAYQADTVSEAVDDFILNLVAAVMIVVGVLCLAMGLACGILIGGILLFTILGTFILMDLTGISLQLISLGALILALGMLVDNAIVVTEGILVKIQRGLDREQAALDTVRQTAWPLLGATAVAILAFAAIGTSQDETGEFCGSLFYVLAYSLGISWLLAVTLTPLFAVRFLKVPEASDETDPYAGRFFVRYRNLLMTALRKRHLTVILLMGLLFTSVWGFGFVEKAFFPDSRRPQFMIDIWRAEGARIEETARDLDKITTYLHTLDHVTDTATFVGQGALRFLLTYDPEMPNPAYGQVLVTVDDYRAIDGLIGEMRTWLTHALPDTESNVKKFVIGTGSGSKIVARFRGPDAAILRQLGDQAKEIMAKDPISYSIRDDWRQPVPVLMPMVVDASARRLGLSRPEIADALAVSATGLPVGVYREKDHLIPILLRLPEEERQNPNTLKDVQIPHPVAHVSLGHLAPEIRLGWEESVIHRKNRVRTLSVICDPLEGNASVLFNRIRPEIEQIPLPPGYTLEWGGEYEESRDAEESIFSMIPFFFLGMVVIVIMLFNALRQPAIIFLCVPLAVIGVTAGLLIFKQAFGFMALLGFLSLSGMLIKNAVVLIDQIDLEIRDGKAPSEAILDASVSRLRPVIMAALTTVLGMIPLVFDPFYAAMSVTIMGGLTFGTVLTLIVVPVLYAYFFRIETRKNHISRGNDWLTSEVEGPDVPEMAHIRTNR